MKIFLTSFVTQSKEILKLREKDIITMKRCEISVGNGIEVNVNVLK